MGQRTTDTATGKHISAPQTDSGQLDNARLPTIMRNGSSLVPSFGNSVMTDAETTRGSPRITVTSATGLVVGQQVFSFPLFPNPTFVLALSGTTVTLSENATVTNAMPVSVQFGQDRWSAASSQLTNTLGADNVYIGAAAEGNYTWLNQWSPGIDYRSLSKLISIPGRGDGGVAATFATRTSDNNGAFGAGLNLQLLTVADNFPTPAKNTWGLYNESDLVSTSSGYHLNEESSIYSRWAYQASDPYDYNALGRTTNLRLDCGKGSGTPQSCSAAQEIIQNGAKYGKGIVFGSDAILPFIDGTQPAIVMAKNQALHWFSANNTPGWNVVSTKTSGAERSLTLSNDAATFTGADVATGAHLYGASGSPTVTSCGTGASLLEGSTDVNGTVTEGKAATGCTLKFLKTYALPPTCVVSSPSGSAFKSYSTSTTTLSIINISASENKYSYICMGG